MNTPAVWWFILLVLVVLGLVGSLLWFWFRKDSNTTRLWLTWGFGVAVYAFISGIVLLAVASPYKAKAPKAPKTPKTNAKVDEKFQQAKNKYNAMTMQAATNEDCKTQRQACIEDAIANREQTASERTEQIATCDKLESTNACVENVLKACSDAIEVRGDAQLYDQFRSFANTKPPQEVLSFCNSALR
jgi:hypothetical protein